MMIKAGLAEIFAKMADILEIRGRTTDRFRIISYRRAAEIIGRLPDLEILKKEEKLREIKGIGDSLRAKTEEYLQTGTIAEYEKLRKSYPDELLDLMKVPGLGAKGVGILHQKLKIKRLTDLEEAAEANKIAGLKGFGVKKQQNILEGIARIKESETRVPIGKVYPIVEALIAAIEKAPTVKRVTAAGSFRRGKETVGDIDLLASGENRAAIIDFFTSLPAVEKIIGRGKTKASVLIKDLSRQVDLRVVKDSQFGGALQYFTGSKEHNIRLRTIAKAKGYKINEYGIFKEKTAIGGREEEEIYETLQMAMPEPEMRENRGEVEAAIKRNLPCLVTREDIRGDLHSHTIWSDGADSIETMIKKAEEKGYEYLAITDHSPGARVANGLSVERLWARNAEIRFWQKKTKIEIFIGSEVDIREDGSLDYPEEVLSQLDVVVASIHSGFKQDNTDRILKAIANRHVKIIGHPSGRLIGRRPPYPFDLEKVAEAARRAGVALEINSSCLRMDLSDQQARLASETGALLAINTDSHSQNSFWTMILGINLARRAGLTKEKIINTWPLEKIRSWLREGRESPF